jgi:LytS/YehU family sensor histidine kinase
VQISASIEPGATTGRSRLVLQVSDTGVGIGQATNGHGMGLSNTRQRLGQLYGSEAELQLSANQPRGVRATILMPLEMA